MAQPLRRSFVHRKLAAAGARFAPFRDALVATDFGQPEAEREALRRLALVDLSPLPRAGFKGPGAPEWLEGEGLTLPPPNQALLAEGGELVVRLAPREVLLLGPPEPREEPSLPDRLQAAWAAASASPRGYPVPPQDRHLLFLVAAEQLLLLRGGAGAGARHVRQTLRRRPQAAQARGAGGGSDAGDAHLGHH